MKKLISILLLIMVISICFCCSSVAESNYKEMIIAEIVKQCTDESIGTTCSYDETSDVLLYRVQLPATHAVYNQMPVEQVGKMQDGFKEMSVRLKQIVIDCKVPEVTTVTTVVSFDNIPIAIFVDTFDVLRGW